MDIGGKSGVSAVAHGYCWHQALAHALVVLHVNTLPDGHETSHDG
jgi:hypothetical protein